MEAAIHTVSHVILTIPESNIVDLYTMGAMLNKGEETKPFIHKIQLYGPDGEAVQIWALFNDSAMKEAMSISAFERRKDT